MKNRCIHGVLAAAAIFAVAACGSSTQRTRSGTTQSASSPVVKTLTPGVLTVAEDEDYPPEIMKKPDGSLGGYDYEILQAIGHHLHLRVKFVEVQFGQAIIGLKGRQYDVYPGLYMTKPRLNAINMVPYFEIGNSLIAKKGGPAPKTGEDLCGLSVGVIAGATVISNLNAQSATCERDGKGKISVHSYPSDPDASQAVLSGNVQVQITSSSVAQGIVSKLSGLTITSGKVLYPSVVSLGVNKGATQLTGSLAKAVSDLVSSGTLTAIYRSYHLSPVVPADVKKAKESS